MPTLEMQPRLGVDVELLAEVEELRHGQCVNVRLEEKTFHGQEVDLVLRIAEMGHSRCQAMIGELCDRAHVASHVNQVRSDWRWIKRLAYVPTTLSGRLRSARCSSTSKRPVPLPVSFLCET